MPDNYLNRFYKIDRMIQKRSTGSPLQFAQKLGLSKSRMYDYINVMKKMGAPIEYDKTRHTYFYKESGTFSFQFKRNNSKS